MLEEDLNRKGGLLQGLGPSGRPGRAAQGARALWQNRKILIGGVGQGQRWTLSEVLHKQAPTSHALPKWKL